MGIFNKLGRRVESFKRTAEEAAEADTRYECSACEEQFEARHDSCPECGGELVVVTG